MLLTSSYSRVQADSPEPFLGWSHFVHELNTFLNKYVTKNTDGMEYVTLGHGLETSENPDQVIIRVFVGQEPPLNYDPEKLISGTKYFLKEHNLKILGYSRKPENWVALVSGLSRYEIPERYHYIKNTWMKNALLKGTVIDVRQVGVEVESGVFKLNHFVPSTQYVDSEEEQFIYSIGKDKNTGEIFAAYDTRFYGDDDYECLYLH